MKGFRFAFRPALVGLAAVALAGIARNVDAAATAFSTDGHTVYHLRPAAVAAGARGVIAAAYDGAVLCYTSEGKRQFAAQAGKDFPYDLCVADIDGDGRDEALVASGDGCLYAIDDDGAPLWTFRGAAPLFQATTARVPDGSTVILGGGVEQQLVALSSAGETLGVLKTDQCIRHLRTGKLLGDGREYVVMLTAARGLSGNLTLVLVDPAGLRVVWSKNGLGAHVHDAGRRFFSLLVTDLNKDGRDDIVLSHPPGGRITAFSGKGDEMFSTSDKRVPHIPYRMNLLRRVAVGGEECIFGHFGNMLIVYKLDGSVKQVLETPYSCADAAFDPATKTWYMGSEVSGGDGIYAVRLDRPGWQKDYESIRPVGRLAQIERNLEELQSQIASFEAPVYQPKPREATVVGAKPKDRQYQSLRFVRRFTWSQKYDSRKELWCRRIDERRKYNQTADEIVDMAKRQEAAGEPFLVWAGHGRAMYFPEATFRRIAEAAPKTLWGFELAEMEGVDREMQELVEKILVPVAEICRKHGKKIIFCNKNIYWNGVCYVPLLKSVFVDGRFRDVFVPSCEETNCRTQELSLAGRFGLWQTGSFAVWSERMVTDNANWDRMFEWGGQQVPTHHLRHLASRATLGADVFFNNVHQGPLTEKVYAKITLFYDMLEKGILRIPDRGEVVSMTDVAIGMRTPSEEFIAHGINGHVYRYPADSHPEMAFDRLDCYWAGAPTAEHDASRYVYGAERRQCNFLPLLPNGLVPIVPADTPAGAGRPFRRVLETDGRYWYDASGKRQTASDYRQTVLAAVREAGQRLPVRVIGPAHWSVVRLDPTRLRVTLIDPGYLDPADRDVEVALQHVDAVACSDPLRGERLPMEAGRIRARIPAGALRILDIEHR